MEKEKRKIKRTEPKQPGEATERKNGRRGEGKEARTQEHKTARKQESETARKMGTSKRTTKDSVLHDVRCPLHASPMWMETDVERWTHTHRYTYIHTYTRWCILCFICLCGRPSCISPDQPVIVPSRFRLGPLFLWSFSSTVRAAIFRFSFWIACDRPRGQSRQENEGESG